jgi:hypothetical protein
MSSPANNSANRTTVASNSGSGGSTGSKLTSFFTGTPGIVLTSLIAVGMFIGSFVSTSKFLGSKDDWNLIKPQITKIWILTLVGTFGFMIAALLYFVQDSAKAMYFILIMTCLSLGLSYSALAVAAITR